jgi:mannosyltransferase OCH1-like enzyme
MAPAATTGGGIPRIIHQVWLGTNPKPTEWMDSVREFATKHGYTYKLWDEKAAEGLDWDSVPGLRREYGAFRSQLAGKADIIRMLALYEHGGIYIDADTVVMRPAKFAAFLEKNPYAVFFGWENILKSHTKKVNNFGPELAGAKRLVANGMIGAAAGHPFFEALLGGVVANAEREEGEDAWRKVGPLYVTRVYAKLKKKMPDVHVYPMRYFYPRHWKGITDPELHKKVRIPGESMLFQYGYTTNGFAEIFRRRAAAARRRTRKRVRT